MPTLADLLNDPKEKERLTRDGTQLVEDEVAAKSGLSGLAIKAALSMVKAVKPGIIPEVVGNLLPEFAGKLDPILATRPEGTKVAAFVDSRTGEVVNALLSVTDARADHTSHATLRKAYERLRPMAEKQVAGAVPRLAKMLEHSLAEKPAPVPPAG